MTSSPVLPAPALDDDRHDHHELPVHEVVLLLGTDHEAGLAEDEAGERLDRVGPNTLPRLDRRGPLRRLAAQIHHPLIYVLLAAALVAGLLGELVDAGVILGVVVVNALVGFVQESRAEQALEALVAMVRTTATVIREGRARRVPSAELVPGDLVLVEAGDKVPADLRITAAHDLKVDESALTGESASVRKASIELPGETALGDRRNMAYSSTLVTSGSGRGVVVATGAGTEIGQIHRLVGQAVEVATPLTRKLARFSRFLTVVILALAALTFAVGLARDESVGDMFIAAIALAVGAIPEGLPAAVTITLAIGVARMARRRAVIRRLPAVETLGSTTVICTDKTGTLTANAMTVQVVVAGTRSYRVTGTGYVPDGAVLAGDDPADLAADPELRECLLAGVLCNDAGLRHENGKWSIMGDPTEAALLVTGAKAGFTAERLREAFPRMAAIPFSSELRYMATLHATPDGGHVIYVKGAVERVLALAGHEPGGDPGSCAEHPLLAHAERLAAQGLRVLALGRVPLPAGRPPERLTEAAIAGRLVPVGLQAMHDPPREDALTAVAACRTAGIDVKMITGDHAATARAIAERFDLGPEDGAPTVLTGPELAAIPEADLLPAVAGTSVFARVSPEQKLHIVHALQDGGHVVAMTGDGVNDAPALKRADIGVAMGVAGTDVAKESADMVLTDDDFASIEAAVEEGRGIFDNLRKFMAWTLPTNLGEGLVILAAVLLGTTLPILPVQILWINMTTAVLLGLTLAFEPREPDVMRRPPYPPTRPLLTADLMWRIVLVSAVLLVGSFGLFQWELALGMPAEYARTVAVNVFVMVEIVYLFNCRSLTRSVLHVGLFSNWWVWGGVGTMVALQLAMTYAPWMNRLFHTAPIDLASWARILAVGLAAFLVVGADKWTRRALSRA